MPEKKPPKILLTQIEFIRVLAMAGIYIFHLWSILPAAGTANPFGPWLGSLFSKGYLGVVAFNIVAGFVLAWPHTSPGGRDPESYPAFLRRRLLRLCPNYYISLIFWVIMALLGGAALGPTLISTLEHLFFVHTLDPARFFDIVPAYWWMGLIFQFYLFFPIFLRIYLKIGPLRAGLLLIFTGLGLWILVHCLAWFFPSSVFPYIDYLFYFNLPARLPEFALGMSMAFAWKASVANSPQAFSLRGFVILCLLAFAAAYGMSLAPYMKDLIYLHIFWILICAGLSLLIFVCPVAAKAGQIKFIRLAGAAAYSFYLLHQPVLDYALKFYGPAQDPFLAFCIVGLLAAGVTFFASLLLDWLSNRVVSLFGKRS